MRTSTVAIGGISEITAMSFLDWQEKRGQREIGLAELVLLLPQTER